MEINRRARFTFPALVVASLLAVSSVEAQTVVYSESFEGSHGWTLNVSTGSNGAEHNQWQVSDAEAGVGAGNCSTAGNGNRTLHVTYATIIGAGAAYDAGGLCGFFSCPETNQQAESPAFSTIGQTNLTLNFDFVAYGDALIDTASVWYDAGSGWTQLIPSLKSGFCGNGSPGFNPPRWEHRTVALPTDAENKSNVKIAFRWTNNDDGVGTDPSVAIDNLTVVSTPTAATPTPTSTATSVPPTPTATATAPPPVGSCPSTPSLGCRVGRNGALIVRNSRKENSGEVEWRFQKGPILSAVDFGDPAGSTRYAVCIYDDGALVGTVEVGPNPSRWSRVGNERGFQYKNKAAGADEVSSMRLDGRVEGGSMVAVDANLRIPPASPQAIFAARSEVTLQLLVSSGGCFESRFSGDRIRWNEPYRVRGLF